MSDTPVIVLFRRDLRLADNTALAAAAATGRPVLALYVHDPYAPFAIEGAQKWWLHHSLESLGRAIETLGSRLLLRRSNPRSAMNSIIGASGATSVFWNRRYLAAEIAADTALTSDLRSMGIEVCTFAGNLLREPLELKTASTGGPYRVFTPFQRALSAMGPAQTGNPGDALRLAAPKTWPASEPLGSWRLTPERPDWAAGFGRQWSPGEPGAQRALDGFLADAADRYALRRDYPADPATSRLSPHLAFGEIAPATIWRAVAARQSAGDIAERQAGKFLSEVAWREFSHHLLHAFPRMSAAPMRTDFERFPWRDDPAALRAWTQGRTGYPIVDAGMRQLWRTGWMHNRVRMVAASFLTKHLLIDWRLGASWFADTLLDYDPASNVANWQWVAGCGADAAPYFRIFNPAAQGEKFDPEGSYVRAFAPELAALPAPFIHRPSEAPQTVLAAAGLRPGETYPLPIVAHAAARARALAAFGGLKSALEPKASPAYV